jgi:hypothetical protein
MVPPDLRRLLYRRPGYMPVEHGDCALPIEDPLPLRMDANSYHAPDGSLVFVKAVLSEPLRLRLRGTKTAVLEGGACHVEALPVGRQDAPSVNTAYTRVSEMFEPARQTHTGNAFTKVRYREGKAWRRLDDLRARLVFRYEHEMTAIVRSRTHEIADDK